eukprot:10717681-Alexandrium_andersonii.AAC.1
MLLLASAGRHLSSFAVSCHGTGLNLLPSYEPPEGAVGEVGRRLVSREEPRGAHRFFESRPLAASPLAPLHSRAHR